MKNKITCVSFMVYPQMDRETTVFFHRQNVKGCVAFHHITYSSWMRLQEVLGGEYMSECFMFSSGGFDIRYTFKVNDEQ